MNHVQVAWPVNLRVPAHAQEDSRKPCTWASQKVPSSVLLTSRFLIGWPNLTSAWGVGGHEDGGHQAAGHGQLIQWPAPLSAGYTSFVPCNWTPLTLQSIFLFPPIISLINVKPHYTFHLSWPILCSRQQEPSYPIIKHIKILVNWKICEGDKTWNLWRWQPKGSRFKRKTMM